VECWELFASTEDEGGCASGIFHVDADPVIIGVGEGLQTREISLRGDGIGTGKDIRDIFPSGFNIRYVSGKVVRYVLCESSFKLGGSDS
jgi:hypothetical protein